MRPSAGKAFLRSRRIVSVRIAQLLAIATLFLPSPTSAQAGLNLTGASNCTAVDFDTTLKFTNGPGDYYDIVIDKRNISRRTCVFDGPMYGPSMVYDQVPGFEPIGICYDCENRLSNGQYPVLHPLPIDPGQAARQVFRWKTTSSKDGKPCVQPKWTADPVLLVAPSLLKPICSDVEVSRFSLVPSVDPTLTPQLNLTSDKDTYYQGEFFSLRISRAESGSQSPSEGERCPTLYLRERSPDGTTRIDEVKPLSFKSCEPYALGHQPGDWQSGFEIDSGANRRWAGVGEHQVQVFQLSSSVDAPQLRFTFSNAFRFQIVDGATVPRRWGPRVEGIAADLTLDSDTFKVGEDISLHLAVANFDAEVPIYTMDPVWDPCDVVSIEVQDAHGRPLPVDGRFPNWSLCTGHGFAPRQVEKGKIIPLEKKLGAEGWLPNHPGTYTIVVT